MPNPLGWSPQKLKSCILTSVELCEVAIEGLYRRQTQKEKTEKKTLRRNGVGFNLADAPTFTRIAEEALENGRLSPGGLAILRAPGRGKNKPPRLWTYRKQIMEILAEAGLGPKKLCDSDQSGPRLKVMARIKRAVVVPRRDLAA